MNPSVFNTFKNENLSGRLIVIKRIGQTCIFVALAGIGATEFYKEEVIFTTIVSNIVGWGLLIGFVCLAIVGLASTDKTKNNTTAQAMGRSFLKVCMYIYLPAIILTTILVVIFVLPRYQ